jgi:membrane fusion protein (multidrug efflux system)
MFLIPALVVLGSLYAYVRSGRYVSTENAYVKGHIVYVAPEVSGVIAELNVTDNQHVKTGDVLLRLREAPFRIARARAEAALADVAIEIRADQIAYQRAQTEIRLHQTAVDYANVQLKRQLGLRASNLGTQQDLDAARYELDSATRQLEVSRQEAATLLARLNGQADAPVEAHPRYQAAKAELEDAVLNLARTVVTAPVSGVVGKRPEMGDYLSTGSPSIAIVSDTELWIDANYKETQLTSVRPEQPAEIRIDAYPGEIWHGRVESIAGATGAEFALLPPQNASGNWVKVVQRIPVRIAVDPNPDAQPLRVGMSTEVIIDTGEERDWRDLLPTR